MSAQADIFEKPAVGSDGKQLVLHVCDCGAVHRINIGWHERILLRCGRMMWAMQLKRGEPLVLRPWPGPPMTARELAQKEFDEREEGWRAGRWAA